jgi:hypothetical protein
MAATTRPSLAPPVTAPRPSLAPPVTGGAISVYTRGGR